MGLSEAKAVEQGSEILSEIIVLTIIFIILISEYRKNKKEDAEIERKDKVEKDEIYRRLYSLEKSLDKNVERIENIVESSKKHSEKIVNETLIGVDKQGNISNKLVSSLLDTGQVKEEVKTLTSQICPVDRCEENTSVEKTISEELIELWEELVEEFLD